MDGFRTLTNTFPARRILNRKQDGKERNSIGEGDRRTDDQNAGARLAVISLGYVELPLAAEFCRQGFDVYGVDKSPEKIELLQEGRISIGDVSEAARNRVEEHSSLEGMIKQYEVLYENLARQQDAPSKGIP